MGAGTEKYAASAIQRNGERIAEAILQWEADR